MPSRTYLIVNADDFGQSPGLNRGVIEAFERGIVTSASLMVHWPAAVEAAAYSRAHPDLSLGLHIDLGEWAYRNDSWVPVYQVVAIEDRAAVAEEVSRQLAAFHRLLDKNPTHIDSHQHMHLREPVRSVLSETASRLGLPLRGCNPVIRYCGDFYGQTADGLPLSDRITVDGLIKILTALPPGLTELACHPGEADDLETMYRGERAQEVRTLCHPIARTAIETMGIQLCSFDDAIRFLGSETFSKKEWTKTGSTK